MRALWIALLVAGCAKDLTKDFEALRDRACACKDKACGTAVLDDLATLAENARKSTADEQKAATATKELGACLLASGVTALEIHEKINTIAAKNAPVSQPAESE
jgi:hypothetical protein